MDDVVEEIVRRIVDAVCCDVPSTSHCTPSTSPADPNPVIERLHCEMVTKAERLMRKVGRSISFVSDILFPALLNGVKMLVCLIHSF